MVNIINKTLPGTQVVWRWRRWQRTQTTLRWSRASGWGQKNMIFCIDQNVFLIETVLYLSQNRWAFMTRRTRPLWGNAFVENFLPFYISIFTLFIFIPNHGTVIPKIYLQTVFEIPRSIWYENQLNQNIEDISVKAKWSHLQVTKWPHLQKWITPRNMETNNS